MKIRSILIAAAAITLAACGSYDSGEGEVNSQKAETRATMNEDNTDELIEPVQGGELSGQKQGYGQGVQTDEKNRPLGAIEFNEKYGQFEATAIGEPQEDILLTFDQGYENGYTAKILDTLNEKNVKAVFFLLHDYAVKNPELVQRMIDEGHILGNHSLSHYSMPDLTDEQCAEEIEGMQEYIEENFGYEMTLFRPPMGEFSERSLAVTQQCGCRTMLWSFAYADWDTESQPEPEASKQKLIEAAHGGAIYLLHSVSATNAEILAEVIDGIRERGFEFEKIS